MLASRTSHVNEWVCFTTVKVRKKIMPACFLASSMLSSTFQAKELTKFLNTPRFCIRIVCVQQILLTSIRALTLIEIVHISFLSPNVTTPLLV